MNSRSSRLLDRTLQGEVDAAGGLAFTASEQPPLARRSVVEELAARLQDRIRREALVPGDRLGTKGELARQYGVSAGTMSSTLRLLDAAGVAAAKPGIGGGVFVHHPRHRLQLGRALLTLRDSGNSALARDSYRSRALLEILLARLAARFRTEDDIRELHATAERMRATYGHEISDYLRANWALHDCIARAAHNETLLAVYRALAAMVADDVERITDSDVGLQRDGSNVRLHQRLVDAVVAGDVATATAVAEEHADRLLARLDANSAEMG